MKAVDRLLSRAREGHSGSLVVRGEAGIGKSALLEYAASQAADMRILRGTGIESERDLPFAGLHLLLHKYLDRIDQLPCAQAAALSAAFGFSLPDKKDFDSASVRFVSGLAVLTMLADLAEERPLLCLIDDAHWLDYESAEALLFAARRLEAEGVVILFAARELHAPRFPASGVDDLRVSPLDAEAAADMLSNDAGDLPGYVRQQILSQSDGNPLALRELAIAQREGHLVPDPYGIGRLPTHSRILRSFADRVAALPPSTQDAMLVAATAGICDSGVILETARKLGATAADLEMAERKDLVTVDGGVLVFRHPLIRAAVYQYAPLNRRTQAHLALAETFAGRGDADRRAWHLATATTGPDEEIAAALEDSAEHSRARGSYSTVAAAYERAAWLSPEPKQRSRRLLAAAQAALEAGQLDRADALTEQSCDLHQDTEGLVDRAMVRATTASWRGSPLTAHQIWIDAAAAIADRVPNNASYMLFHAVEAAWIAADFEAVRRSAELAEEWGLAHADRVRAMARVVAGMNNHPDGSMFDAVTAIRQLMNISRAVDESSPQSAVRIVWWLLILGDHVAARDMVERLIKQCRETGAMGVLPRALGLLSKAQLYAGEHRDAVATASEALRIAGDIGKNLILIGVPVSVMAQIAAIEGDRERCHDLVVDASPGMKYGLVVLEGMLGLLDMGLGRYEAVVQRLKPLVAGDHAMDVLPVVPDLVEAAVRTGVPEVGVAPTEWFGQYAEHTGQSWARGVALRCEALLADDARAEKLFQEALRAHGNAGARPFEEARTELLYGEWLRRNRRRVDARVQLRSAMVTFERMGAKPWIGRTETELRATGEAPSSGTDHDGLLERLTPQELQVVRLAATGLTNRDIGGQLFLSPRTVGYHLYKAYPKLGVSSRGELARLDLSA